MKSLHVLMFIALSAVSLADEDSHWKKAEQLVRLGGTGDVAETTLRQLEIELEQTVNDMYQTFTDEYFMSPDINEQLDVYEAEAKEVLRQTFSAERFIELSIPVYMANFSEAELDELIEFYQSPLGKKLNERLPTIMLQSQAIGEELGLEYIKAMEPINQKLNEALGLVQ